MLESSKNNIEDNFRNNKKENAVEKRWNEYFKEL